MVIAGGSEWIARGRRERRASTEPAMVIAGGEFRFDGKRIRGGALQRSRRW